MTAALRSLRLALRQIRSAPMFALLVVAMLSLGIGAVTAIFALVKALSLQALPYPDADRLVFVNETVIRRASLPVMVSYPNVTAWNESVERLESVAVTRALSLPVEGPDGPRLIDVNFVSDGYLEMLGARAAVGTLLGREADPRRPVAVVHPSLADGSAGLGRFDIGDPIRIQGRVYAVVGVVDDAFRDIYDPTPTDVWLPVGAIDAQFPDFDENRRRRSFLAVGKLAAGASMDTALSELESLAASLALEYPAANDGFGVALQAFDEAIGGELDDLLWVLLAGAGFLLLVAVINVAGLVAVRGAAAHREIATRRALGASAATATRPIVMESLALSAVGALAGFGLAALLIRFVEASGVITVPTYVQLQPDWRVGLFAAAVALLSGLLSSVLPTFGLARRDVFAALASGGGRGAVSTGSVRVRRAMVVAQVAAAVLVVAGAGVLIRSLAAIRDAPTGMRAESVIAAPIDLPRDTHDVAAVARVAEDLRRAYARVDGVRFVAAWGPGVPLLGAPLETIHAEGSTFEDHEAVGSRYHVVSSGALADLAIPIVAGRALHPDDDAASLPVAVVSEDLAAALWPQGDALGKQITPNAAVRAQGGDPDWYTVVGVAANARLGGRIPTGPGEDRSYDLFYTLAQHDHRRRGELAMLVGVDPRVEGLAADLRAAALRAGVLAPVDDLLPLEQVLADEEALPGFTAFAMALFGAAALGLATLGIYGALAQTIAQRRREIGLRKALGAPSLRILVDVGAPGMVMAALGLVAGLLLSISGLRVLDSLLYQVGSDDLTAMLAVSALVLGVALLAALVPARRAARMSPAEVLRES